MSKYVTAFKLKLSDLRAFPADFYTGFLAMPLQIGVVYFFWRNSLGTGEVNGITASGLGAYFVSLQVLRLAMEPGLVVTWELWRDINRGNLTVWLARPLYYPAYVFAQKLSEFLVKSTIGVVAVLMPVLVLTRYITLSRLLWGYISGLLGLAVLFLLHFLIGSLTVFVGNVLTLRDNIINFTTLFGGGLLPLSMMPRFLQTIAAHTPMPSVYYVPARILSDPRLSRAAMLALFREQCLWIGILGFAVTLIWRAALKHFNPQGG